jgi:UDP-galactopyranose mutase
MKKFQIALSSSSSPDLICFSHLRWNFVFQRPQHLMSRMANEGRVFFFEEPVMSDSAVPELQVREEADNLFVATPHLPRGYGEMESNLWMKKFLNEMMVDHGIIRYLTWYYSPMHLKHSHHLRPVVSVYDCMDQLSTFKGAPQELPLMEQSLLNRVDLVFTGGFSLFNAKRHLHQRVYPFPSSVDVAHFAQARDLSDDPEDQAGIAGPRLGYIGVIDERVDLELIDQIATQRPDWQIIMVGPVVKIDPATLPRRPNIHYLGGKNYEELPRYLAGWDIAILPFARNEATRYISPTKTPEYLSAGCRVISTSIRDVVHPYGVKNLVAIADDAEAFIIRAESILADRAGYDGWLNQVDGFLKDISWDKTFASMWKLVNDQFVVKDVMVTSTVYGTQA